MLHQQSLSQPFSPAVPLYSSSQPLHEIQVLLRPPRTALRPEDNPRDVTWVFPGVLPAFGMSGRRNPQRSQLSLGHVHQVLCAPL